MKVRVGSLFILVTVASAGAFFLTNADVDSYTDREHQANVNAGKAHDELREAYCRVYPNLCYEGIPMDWGAMERRAGEEFRVAMAQVTLYRNLAASARKRADKARAVCMAIFWGWIFTLPAFASGFLAERARTRGQRIGLILFSLSPACLVAHCLRLGSAAGILSSPELLAFLAAMALGVLLFLRIPQRLLAWIASGARD